MTTDGAPRGGALDGSNAKPFCVGNVNACAFSGLRFSGTGYFATHRANSLPNDVPPLPSLPWPYKTSIHAGCLSPFTTSHHQKCERFSNSTMLPLLTAS